MRDQQSQHNQISAPEVNLAKAIIILAAIIVAIDGLRSLEVEEDSAGERCLHGTQEEEDAARYG